MIALPALVLLPLAGGTAAWLAGRGAGPRGPWRVTLATLALLTLLLLYITWRAYWHAPAGGGPWLAHFAVPWIPALGIAVRCDLDGLGLVMLWLTVVLSWPCVLLASRDIGPGAGVFHLLLLATVAGVDGVFIATDLFLFFFFWELMLVPLYVLITGWGHEDRARAAIKFFLFTQGSGLLMLLSILGLAIAHFRQTGVLTFDYFALAGTMLAPGVALALASGFFVAFAVKLPVVPLHVWLPDTHTQAPTAGSVLLAGVLLKTGGYGLIRFVALLFPDAASRLAPLALVLGVAGVLYGAMQALVQDDLKRLIAYSSVSHLGFVLMGVFSGSALGMEGAVVQMLAHGLSTGALFVIAGALQDRLHTRDLRRMGGLWAVMPHLSAMGLVFAVASLGLPGLGNFVGEFLVLLATWRISPLLAVLAASGLVLSALYGLTMVSRAFQGPLPVDGVRGAGDFGARHMAVLGGTVALLIGLGLCPQPVLDLSQPARPTVSAP
ncbi:proton-translocating NADH-quinone oxidoreductase, chain M [Gluconacetobacter diazotrophicus PA1 5]|uniref:NADH-quinone oxidoreductase subunit M n=2 Tax=Gluconacetobacter diazotrophicus TaxID=33996 RepID=A0A7W4FDD2_GLUDI|nr:NADH-quinone oxidoreductase subunit M [Gluconacetobacter diazotrophicus]ACI50497.1 proton-translocating NADH-quinone oxidoreductase, chain M [Gluconacetobacter diazotrophicus PA1 5]MBB2155691.1 NADH-quinone oxidoreductase subunit M [Gluconacetobacter diazotrophicus]TWB02772.1 NADH dehydrogenase subunit M [Gluconacetobacter diazotrophicus]CAP56403.1 putative NADH-quinone oxidoreductase chain M [Gluconacetobacter diazotrophicus PA1 5]